MEPQRRVWPLWGWEQVQREDSLSSVLICESWCGVNAVRWSSCYMQQIKTWLWSCPKWNLTSYFQSFSLQMFLQSTMYVKDLIRCMHHIKKKKKNSVVYYTSNSRQESTFCREEFAAPAEAGKMVERERCRHSWSVNVIMIAWPWVRKLSDHQLHLASRHVCGPVSSKKIAHREKSGVA